jgi:hypothetical protein
MACAMERKILHSQRLERGGRRFFAECGGLETAGKSGRKKRRSSRSQKMSEPGKGANGSCIENVFRLRREDVLLKLWIIGHARLDVDFSAQALAEKGQVDGKRKGRWEKKMRGGHPRASRAEAGARPLGCAPCCCCCRRRCCLQDGCPRIALGGHSRKSTLAAANRARWPPRITLDSAPATSPSPVVRPLHSPEGSKSGIRSLSEECRFLLWATSDSVDRPARRRENTLLSTQDPDDIVVYEKRHGVVGRRPAKQNWGVGGWEGPDVRNEGGGKLVGY